MTAPPPPASAFVWHPPRHRPRDAGSRWGDWAPVLHYFSGRARRRMLAEVTQAEQWVAERQGWSGAQIEQRLRELKCRMRMEWSSGDRAGAALRADALACIALAAQHALGKRPYGVQMLAALAMHEGYVVQMAAGEGKTIAVALAGVLYGWAGRPCHVVTSNDYLAQRDVELMSPLYRLCGVSVAAVVPDSAPEALAASYRADVAYATGKQLLADFLRDHIALDGATDALRRRLSELGRGRARREPVMRGLYATIVDEADSVLIDEANTPLIISSAEPDPMMAAAVLAADAIAGEFRPGEDYRVDANFRDVRFTDAGERRLEQMTRRLPPIWHGEQRRKELVGQAITARELFERDRHYIVHEDKVVIVDENTGRAMPGRSWSYGLHQAIEAKEGLEISHPSRTMARMSFQDFFRRYHRLCGASGTLHGIRSELWWTYGLLTFVVPTRLPSQLVTHPYRHFRTAEEKRRALVTLAAEWHAQGHPVLVGTRKLSDSEALEQEVRRIGLDCNVLNAKQHAVEAEVIARAGESGRLTVATNMAGRGTDIAISPDVAARGGLHVLMLEPHESARVDWQLFGRAGRQGAPGHAQAFVSLEDDLLVRQLPWALRGLLPLCAANASLRARLILPLLKTAQFNAQWRSWRQRRQLQQRDRLMKRQLSFTDESSGSR